MPIPTLKSCIVKEKEPIPCSVQGALEKIDQKLCDCGDEKTNIVPEIFLPVSVSKSQEKRKIIENAPKGTLEFIRATSTLVELLL